MNENMNQFEDGTEITPYLATGYAEGFEGENASVEDQLKAWAYLIRTGIAWSLQGFFGRTADGLIQKGLIYRDGQINFEKLDDVLHAQCD